MSGEDCWSGVGTKQELQYWRATGRHFKPTTGMYGPMFFMHDFKYNLVENIVFKNCGFDGQEDIYFVIYFFMLFTYLFYVVIH